jgi:hypothetical protein
MNASETKETFGQLKRCPFWNLATLKQLRKGLSTVQESWPPGLERADYGVHLFIHLSTHLEMFVDLRHG